MNFIRVTAHFDGVKELNIALDRTSTEKMLSHGFKNVICVKDLYSFALGGMPINQQRFDYWLCKELKVNSSYFSKDVAVRNMVLSSRRLQQAISDDVADCMNLIDEYCLGGMLSLYLQVLPIIHQMYSRGFKIDMQAITNIYADKKAKYEQLSANDFDSLSVDEKDELNKLKKFIDSFNPTDMVMNEGCNTIHANYEVIGTETFRMTTNNINLLGIPKVYREHLLPRKEGNSIVEIDMSSSHIVILAYLSGEKVLIDKYLKGEDLYVYLGSLFFNTSLKLSATQRKVIKVVMLMILNGAGTKALLTKVKEIDENINDDILVEGVNRLYSELHSVSIYLEYLKNSDEIQLPDNGRLWKGNLLPEPYKRISRVLQTLESQILWVSLIAITEELKSLQDCRLYLTLHDAVYIECPKVYTTHVEEVVTDIINSKIRRVKRCQY